MCLEIITVGHVGNPMKALVTGGAWEELMIKEAALLRVKGLICAIMQGVIFD